MSVNPQEPRRASHRRRRWLIAGASLLVLVIAARIAAPYLMIQAENLIAGAGAAFQDALPRLFPERVGRTSPATEPPPEEAWHDAHIITSDGRGYLQRIDDQRLLQLGSSKTCAAGSTSVPETSCCARRR